MGNSDSDPLSFDSSSKLSQLKRRLEANKNERAKVEAAIRFLEANPDAQALLEFLR